MNDLLKKLNFSGTPRVLALDVPDDLAGLIEALSASSQVDRTPRAETRYGFVIGFVTKLDQVQRVAELLDDHLEPGDAAVWLCYPKGSSKRYKCEFNRDTGWAALGALGFEGVRQIAVDADWSALRFRRAAFIKTLRRDPSRAMSASGKARTTPSSDGFQAVFERLRDLMKPLEPHLRLNADASGRYSLDTLQVRDDGYVYSFGGVEIKKNYVSFHLLPVYATPELLEGVSDELRARMQGKSCFNFKCADDALFAELGALTRRGFESVQRAGHAR
jgi:hypothetical protein